MGLFKKPEEEIVAIFDVGNGSIGGALVKLRKYERPIVLYTHREPLTFVPHPNAKTLLISMLKMLKTVAKNIAKDGLTHVGHSIFGFHRLKDVYCVYSSPWYISQTKMVRDEQDKPFTVTRDVINSIIKKEQEQFNKNMQEGKYQNILGPDTRVFEKRIINVKLNGYEIAVPIGKHAKQLELTLFSSYISQEILDTVENILRESLSIRNIHHSSYGLVSWSASQVLFPDVHDYLFVDISGETTDISLISKDVLIETVSFPMGRSTLLRQVVKELNVESEIALSYVRMFFAKTLDSKFEAQVSDVMKKIEEDWHDQFAVALKQFQKTYSLPRATYLTTDSDTLPFYVKALERNMPIELNLPRSALAVTVIGPDTVQSSIEQLPNVYPDPFLALESIFINYVYAHIK
jgi:hypothetical protein